MVKGCESEIAARTDPAPRMDAAAPERGSALDSLRVLATLAQAVGAAAVESEASARAERLREGRFFVACLGQFKRGKSSVLNALVGFPLLPTGVVPVTSAVTILRQGASPPRAVVHFSDGTAQDVPTIDLAHYVTEAGNPRNRKRVAAVELFVPSPLLANGLCLVDTPGLGSVFGDASRVTRTFVPHIDAALVVLGSDPPVSGEELDLIAEVAAQTHHLIFALNKADRVSEADARDAGEFTARVIRERLGRPVAPCLHISAAERLENRRTRDWQALEQAVGRLAAHGAEVAVEAVTQTVQRLAARLVHDIDEQQAALGRPLQQSEQRLADLRGTVADAERTLRDLGALFTVEQVSLTQKLRDAQREFLAGTHTTTARDLEAAIAAAPERRTRALRARAMNLARRTAKHRVLLWRESVDPVGETLYRQAMERFGTLSSEFLRRLRASSGSDTGLPSGVDAGAGFTARSEFFFTDLMSTAEPPIPLWLLDRVWPRSLALPSIRRRARVYLDRLLETNSARVANDLEERIRQSAHLLETEIRAGLQEAAESATRALERARAQQAAGAQAVEAETKRLAALRAQTIQIGGGPHASTQTGSLASDHT